MKIAGEALDVVRREEVMENPYLKGRKYL